MTPAPIQTPATIRHVLPLVVLCLFALAPSIVVAQEASPQSVTDAERDKQIELNNAAVRAIGEEDFTKAISFLEESNYIGELNITYLNLGRAYQMMGRCKQARQALRKVDQAPEVEQPAPGLVRRKAQQYLSELSEECDDARTSESSRDEADSGLASDDTRQPEPGMSEQPSSQPETRHGRAVLGYALVGVGVAAGASSVVMSVSADGVRDDALTAAGDSGRVSADQITQREFADDRQKYERLKTGALSAAIAGGVLVGTGTYLLLTKAPTERRAHLGFSVSGGAVAVNLSGAF